MNASGGLGYDPKSLGIVMNMQPQDMMQSFRTGLLGVTAAMFIAGNPAASEDLHAQAMHRAPYVMDHACALIDMLRVQKIDGQWVGRRSLWRGELPVSGPISRFLTRYYGFSDAIAFRHHMTQFDIAAKHWSVIGALDPDMLGSEEIIQEIDTVLIQILEGSERDPWEICGQNK
ncbi:hypothetical protein [Paracoccus versutus]